jgi:O-antigen ligase
MRWLRSITREILGLFVDDGSFALAILVWLSLLLMVARLVGHTGWLGLALFGGLAIILVESVLRFARRHRTK